jgi:hypothetical protein
MQGDFSVSTNILALLGLRRPDDDTTSLRYEMLPIDPTDIADPVNWADLPEDVIWEIADRLMPPDLVSLSQSGQRTRNIIRNRGDLEKVRSDFEKYQKEWKEATALRRHQTNLQRNLAWGATAGGGMTPLGGLLVNKFLDVNAYRTLAASTSGLAVMTAGIGTIMVLGSRGRKENADTMEFIRDNLESFDFLHDSQVPVLVRNVLALKNEAERAEAISGMGRVLPRFQDPAGKNSIVSSLLRMEVRANFDLALQAIGSVLEVFDDDDRQKIVSRVMDPITYALPAELFLNNALSLVPSLSAMNKGQQILLIERVFLARRPDILLYIRTLGHRVLLLDNGVQDRIFTDLSPLRLTDAEVEWVLQPVRSPSKEELKRRLAGAIN